MHVDVMVEPWWKRVTQFDLCTVNDGEMNRISSGQARNDAPTASLRSRSCTREGSRPKARVNETAQPMPAAPAPTTTTSTCGNANQ